MSNVANILLEKDILLESGTNELEVLVFGVADFLFGINVAKVREVLPTGEITGLPRAHHSICGVFKLRDHVIPCVSLTKYLGVQSKQKTTDSKLILTDFNNQQTAFLVDHVEKIHRLSWENIMAVPSLVALANTPVTSVTRCEDRLIVMLDFEMIIDQVTEQYFRTGRVENPYQLPREQLKIILVDDSPTVREAVGETLRSSGYTQIEIFENGAQVWQWLQQQLQAGTPPEDIAQLLISDVEMPQVDGLHLTKLIKEHPQLRPLPVLLYSSIVTPDNFKKGAAVGADEQISKPELTKVVELADRLITEAIEHRHQVDDETASGDDETASGDDETASGSDMAASGGEQNAERSASRISDSEFAEKGPDAEMEPPENNVPTSEVPSFKAKPEAVKPASQTSEPQKQPCPVADEKLWQIFCTDLVDRLSHLQALLDQADQVDCDAGLINGTFRTLHTIKSASMVVPVDEVTRITHLVESLLEVARDDASQWPRDSLRQYWDWLNALVSPGSDARNTLKSSSRLEMDLASVLTRPAQ